MKEGQNVELKEHWRDEYIKWICGFANAQGGKLIIGMNDKGVAAGLSNVHKLLEDIPNKVRDILGIIGGVLYFMTYVFIYRQGQKTWNTDCADDADAHGYDLPVFVFDQ